MKSLYNTILAVAFVPVLSFAQGASTTINADEIEQLPLFNRGTSILNLVPNLRYSSMNDGLENKTTTNDVNLNLRGNYYLWDHIGLVGGVHLNNKTIKQEGANDQQTKLFLVELGAQYGTYLGKIPLQLEATIALGNYEVFGSSAFTTVGNLNISTYLPIGETGAFIQPFLGYAGFTNNFKDSDFKNITNGFVLGATLVRPVGCAEYVCGFGDEAPFGNYSKGSNRVQFLQEGVLGLGNNKRESNGSTFSHDGLFGFSINLTDYYYVDDNLAAGLGAEVTSLTTSDKDSDYKTSNFDLYITPRVRYHAPIEGAVNGLFVDGGVLFGSMSNNITNADGSENDTKSSTFGWNVGLGYDVFISKNFSVTGILDYIDKTHTNKDTDAKTEDKGVRFMLGMSYTF